MTQSQPQEAQRLAESRDEVRSFLVRKKRFGTILWICAGFCECTFFVLMLVTMNFEDKFNWFVFFGFLMTYMPLILFTWRNAVMIDRLYYRLVADLKYGDPQ